MEPFLKANFVCSRLIFGDCDIIVWTSASPENFDLATLDHSTLLYENSLGPFKLLKIHDPVIWCYTFNTKCYILH